MAIPYLTNIDLNKNQALNMVLQIIAGEHGTPVEGLIQWDSSAGVVKVYDGADFISLGAAGGGGDADTLDGQNGTFYLGRANHTGTQLAATISDFGTAVNALLTSYATETYVDDAVAALVDSAPGTLDTLNELAAALGDDPDFATTLATNLAAKADKFSGNVGDGSSTSIVVTHNLGTRDVAVQVYPTTNQYRVVVTEG
jgi:hypothetical protein